MFRTVLEHWLTCGPSEQLWMATATLEQPGEEPAAVRPVIRFVPLKDPGLA
ncbi:hypothetical protein D3C73_1621510 [compost metagenome]